MNKKGTTAFVFLMIAVLVALLGMSLAPSLIKVTNDSTTLQQHPANVSMTSGLDCDNASIGYQEKSQCTSLEFNAFLFYGLIFGLVGIIIAGVAQ